jgi:hypothetical protein
MHLWREASVARVWATPGSSSISWSAMDCAKLAMRVRFSAVTGRSVSCSKQVISDLRKLRRP